MGASGPEAAASADAGTDDADAGETLPSLTPVCTAIRFCSSSLRRAVSLVPCTYISCVRSSDPVNPRLSVRDAAATYACSAILAAAAVGAARGEPTDAGPVVTDASAGGGATTVNAGAASSLV